MEIEDIANEIFTTLGPGYSERVYHTAMEVMLRELHVPYESERNIQIPFKGHIIGYLRADIIVDNSIILEFKTIKTLNEAVEVLTESKILGNSLNMGIKRNVTQSTREQKKT